MHQKALFSSLGVPGKVKDDFLAFFGTATGRLEGPEFERKHSSDDSFKQLTMICSLVHHIRYQRGSREDLGPYTAFSFLRIDKPDTNFLTFI